MRALVVGRFQPLHNGHVRLVRQAIEECVDVAIGIGSANARPSARNPFSVDERVAMVRAVFPDLRVVPLPDFGDNAKWLANVEREVGAFQRMYGNDPATADIFAAAGYEVRSPGLWERQDLESTNVRRLMAEDDPAWRRHCPAAVVRLLDLWDGAARVRSLG